MDKRAAKIHAKKLARLEKRRNERAVKRYKRLNAYKAHQKSCRGKISA